MNGWLFLAMIVWTFVLFLQLVGALMVVTDDERLFPDKLKILMGGSFIISLTMFLVTCFHIGGAL